MKDKYEGYVASPVIGALFVFVFVLLGERVGPVGGAKSTYQRFHIESRFC
jgi:hypothetical protein